MRQAKLIIYIILMCCTLSITAYAGDTVINSVNFPDVNFRDCINEEDINSDGVLSEYEKKSVKGLDLFEINSIKGIEFFENLEELYIEDGQLEDFGFDSELISLKRLSVVNCKLKRLDVSNVPNLAMLDCSDNMLSEIDISNNRKLKGFYCDNNNLEKVNFKNNILLEHVSLSHNKLSAIDIGALSNLCDFDCDYNNITSLDVSNNGYLGRLHFRHNNIKSIDLTKNSNLYYLHCDNNPIKMIDLSMCNHVYERMQVCYYFPNNDIEYLSDMDKSYNDNIVIVIGDDSYIMSFSPWTEVVFKHEKSGLLLGKPTLSVTNNDSGVSLSWNNITGANQYIIYRQEGDGLFYKYHTTSDTTYVDKDVSKREYTYFVTATKYSGDLNKVGIEWQSFKSNSCTVKISEKIKPSYDVNVSSIKIKANPSTTICAGKKVSLTATVSPKNAVQGVTWKSSNKDYATVTSKGVVTTKKAGIGKTVTITAKAKDGSGKTAKIRIKIVKDGVTKIKLKGKTSRPAGKQLTIKATVTAGKTANTELKWISSNKEYATVNKNGVVTLKDAGKGKYVRITAMATDGTGVKASIKIKIT